MKVKGPLFYIFYCFFVAVFAFQAYCAYHAKSLGETALYGLASVACGGLMLYARSTRKPEPPAV